MESITDREEYETAVALWKYQPPWLLVFGLVGNVLVFVVLSKSAMRQTTTSLYLRFLAVFDILLLYTGLMRQWIIRLFHYDLREHNLVVCKIHTWATYWAAYTSAWLLVSVTLERCFSVWFPHKVKLIFTKRRTYIIIVTIIVLLAILSAHYLYGLESNVYDTSDNKTVVDICDFISDDYYFFEQIAWPWIDLSFYSLIPSSILVVCNISIIYKVVSSSRHLLQNESANDNTIQNRSVTSRKSQASSLTAMLLITSTAYVVLTTPVCGYLIYSYYYVSELDPAVDELVWTLVNMLQYINQCINFILYCASGRRFRDELKNLCCRQKRRRPQIYSVRCDTRSTNVDCSASISGMSEN